MCDPTVINQTKDFDGVEVEVLGCLQHLVIEGIRLKSFERKGGLVDIIQ
jgi:DNA polymerase-3 subunit delta'